jgi:hypothetical protein
MPLRESSRVAKPPARRMRKCHNGKRAFPTLDAARAAAADMARRKEKQGSPIVTYLRAYGCACGQFHFGKTRDIDWSRVK